MGLLYLDIKNEKNFYFIFKLIEENLIFFLVLIILSFVFYSFCLCLWLKKRESFEWGDDFMLSGDCEI